MKQYIKNRIRKYLRDTGRKVVAIDHHAEKLEPVKNNWLKNIGIDTVIDIGGARGGFAKEIRAIFPDCQIYSFEPLTSSFKVLQNSFSNDKKFEAYNVALTNFEGETTFYECEFSNSSSLLAMSDLHKQAYPETANNTPIKVKCDTLDSFVNNKNIKLGEKTLLKIDVQGAEKLVLEGAEETLKNVDLIYSEINFNQVYENAVSFNDLSEFLYKRGFKIEGISHIAQSTVDGKYLQGDAYFRKIK